MMVAAVIFLCEAALRVNRAAKLTSPDNERFIQQPAGLQILHESVAGLIHVLALHGEPPGYVSVRVPVV